MASERTITELAALIEKNTKILKEGTKEQAGGDFSFTFALPPQPMTLGPSLDAVRNEALEALDELKARLLGPFLYMGSLALPIPAIIVVFDSIYRFDLASHVPTAPGESITYEALSARSGMPHEDLRRVLQTAVAYRIFEEVEADVSIRHNAVSALFSLVPGVRDALPMLIKDNTNAALHFVQSLLLHPGSGEPGHAALMIAERAESGLSNEDGVDDPSKGFFDFIAHDEERVTRFNNTMGMSTRAPGYAVTHFLDNVPWADATRCPRSIVDVGGAGGDLCKQILRRYPGVQSAVSVDLPNVIATAEIPDELKGRLKFAPYNFLTEVMGYEADVYVFRHIFHDWSDQYAVKILRNLASGLKDGTKVLINEVVMPKLNKRNHLGDQRYRGADLLMKIGLNGKERSRLEWETILAEADGKFRIENIIWPEGAIDAVIEIIFGA